MLETVSGSLWVRERHIERAIVMDENEFYNLSGLYTMGHWINGLRWWIVYGGVRWDSKKQKCNNLFITHSLTHLVEKNDTMRSNSRNCNELNSKMITELIITNEWFQFFCTELNIRAWNTGISQPLFSQWHQQYSAECYWVMSGEQNIFIQLWF